MSRGALFVKLLKHSKMADDRYKRNEANEANKPKQLDGITKPSKQAPTFSPAASAASGRQLPSRIPGVSNHSINSNGYKRKLLLVPNSNLAPIDEYQISLLTGRTGKITARDDGMGN